MVPVDAFLSYNSQDEDIARRLGAQLQLVGANVWFGEWEVRPGDSLPRKVNEALATVDTVILIWSHHAHRSKWVQAEFEAAITRAYEESTVRVIPLRLDDTPLPELLRGLKWTELRDDDITRAVNEIMGFANDQNRLRAIQATLEEARIDVRYFEGYGLVVCCPRCGAGIDRLRGWSRVDHSRDDTYAGFKCEDCGCHDGGEI
jgi:TIR domain